MEEKKTIFDYLAQTLITFGITVVLLITLGYFFGEEAQDISSIFSLGKEGLAVGTLLQFLIVSFAVTFFRFLFFTDVIIKRMPLIARTICMLMTIIALIVVMVLLFDWFPADMWQPWAMFLFSFGICTVISVVVTFLKERMDNRKMQEALEKLKRLQDSNERDKL